MLFEPSRWLVAAAVAAGLSIGSVVAEDAMSAEVMEIEPSAGPGMAIDGNPPHRLAGFDDQTDAFVTTHVIARLRLNVMPAELDDGRWTLRQIEAVNQDAFGPDVAMDWVAEHQLSPMEQDLARRMVAWTVTSIEPALRVTPADAARATQLGLDRYHLIQVPPGTDLQRFAIELSAFDDLIERVEFDGIGGIAGTMPNDPHFNLQYGLHNVGQPIQGSAGVPGADIGILDAWSITSGEPGLVVAVLDSGVNLHIELGARLLPGWNVVENESNTADQCFSHGTHVAGIIAASSNNGIGIAGINPAVDILPIVVLSGCSGSETSAGNGIIYAVDAGADVINMSLQYLSGTSFLHDAVQYATTVNVPVIAAAGNQGYSGGVAFPARWPETIAIAATTNTDSIWSGSNSGPELDVAAPGHNVYSLFDLSNYGYKSGTSMATPHVSGTVSLMLTLDPTLTNEEIRQILQSTAKDLGSTGFNEDFGHGRIDAHAALLEVQAGLSIPGDLTGSGDVGVADLLIMLGQWGPCPPSAPCLADLDGSGSVGVGDLLILLINWG